MTLGLNSLVAINTVLLCSLLSSHIHVYINIQYEYLSVNMLADNMVLNLEADWLFYNIYIVKFMFFFLTSN